MLPCAQELADDAVDAVSDVYKQHREEVRNLQHSQKAEQLAKNKAGELPGSGPYPTHHPLPHRTSRPRPLPLSPPIFRMPTHLTR
jgi:hypothetical protein